MRLLPGVYFITLIIGSGSGDLDRIDQAAQVAVESADVFHTGFAPEATHGVFYQEAEWKFTNSLSTTDPRNNKPSRELHGTKIIPAN